MKKSGFLHDIEPTTVAPLTITTAPQVALPPPPPEARVPFFQRVGNWLSNKDNLDATQQRAENTSQNISNLSQITANIRDTFNPQSSGYTGAGGYMAPKDNTMTIALLGVAGLGGLLYFASKKAK